MINKGLGGDLAWLNGRPLYASISGGKDSAALGLWLQDQGIKFTPVFLDTGWEHPATYEYIKDVLTPQFGKFLVLRNDRYFDESEEPEWMGGMEQTIKYNKMFPSGVAKFCTRTLKVEPIRNFYAEKYAKGRKKPINIVGIRGEESKARSEMCMVEEQDEATVWRPLLHWLEDEVIALHKKHNLPPNPLYLKGASRVGCFPCIYARKHEIRHLSYVYPERIDRIRELECKVNSMRRDDQKPATFFKTRSRGGPTMFIDDIVAWSRDKRGLYLDDVEEIEEGGCMRWGMCEPVGKQIEFDFTQDND